MKGLRLTPKEEAIIHQLLAAHNIPTYEVTAIPEGRDLPGSSYSGEIQHMSGSIITPTTVYDFWLDWKHGSYTLGEEDGGWYELDANALGDDSEADYIRESQRRLRQEDLLRQNKEKSCEEKEKE